MTMYVVNVSENGHVPDGDIRDDIMMLHSDLIRGYTTNRFIMMKYCEYIRTLIGDNFTVHVFEKEVPDDKEILSRESETYAVEIHNKYKPDYIKSISFITEIVSAEINDDISLYATQNMIDYITETFMSENEFIENLFFLFDPIMKYIPYMNDNQDIYNLRQYIFDSIKDIVEDTYSMDGQYTVNPYGVVKWYIDTLRFLD